MFDNSYSPPAVVESEIASAMSDTWLVFKESNSKHVKTIIVFFDENGTWLFPSNSINHLIHHLGTLLICRRRHVFSQKR